ncbi:MAG: type III pantothenate kinase [Dyella sp.]
MKLLLDLGNTRLKWALRQDASWLAQGAVAWEEDVEAVLADAWLTLPAANAVWAASVVDPAREAQVGAVVDRRGWPTPQWVRTPAEGCGVRNGYAQPQWLGVDRFLALVAAHAHYRSACVVVGVGTALTLDALDQHGQHLGGLIAPGPRLMQQSVLGATVQVRPAGEGAITDAADNTADGLYSGCWQASAALIERFVTRMTPRLGGRPLLALGGGDAVPLRVLLEYPSVLLDDGVLQGLALWASAQASTIQAD